MSGSFGDLIDCYVDGMRQKVERQAIKPSYYRRCRSLADVHLRPYFGGMDVREWDDVAGSKAKLRAFVEARLGRGLSPRSILRALSLLRQIHSDARFEDRIHAPDLAEAIGRFDLDRPTKTVRPFTANEVRCFLRTLEKQSMKKPGDKAYELLFRVCFLAGLRIGEAAALESSDIDISNGIRVEKTLDWSSGRASEYQTVRPKSLKSKRFAPLTPELAAALKAPRPWQAASALIFASPSGGYRSYQTIHGVFRRTIARAGLPEELTIHSLRHSHATLRLEAGENVWAVSRDLGHANVKVTDCVYGSSARASGEGRARSLDAISRKILTVVR